MLAIVALLAPAGIATALPPTHALPRPIDYPTWDEVQQAQADAAAAAAMVANIGSLLDALRAESARLNDRALEQAAAAAAADSARADAEAALEQLEHQAAAAATRADLSSARAAQVVAALVRSSGPDLTLVLLADQDDSCSRASACSSGSAASSTRSSGSPQFERNAARALAEQADATRDLLADLAEAARIASDDAARAAATADAAVADQQAHLSELYDQLAVLQGTSSEQERLYRIGQQASNEPDDPGQAGRAEVAAVPTSGRSAMSTTTPPARRRSRGPCSRSSVGQRAATSSGA